MELVFGTDRNYLLYKKIFCLYLTDANSTTQDIVWNWLSQCYLYKVINNYVVGLPAKMVDNILIYAYL